MISTISMFIWLKIRLLTFYMKYLWHRFINMRKATNDCGHVQIAASKGHLYCLMEEVFNDKAKYESQARKSASYGVGLSMTCTLNQVQCCEFLLLMGASVQVQTSAGMLPIELAIDNGNLAILELLVYFGTPVNNNSYEIPLICRAANGQPSCLKFLIDSEADINAKCLFGRYSALHVAAECGSIECVKLLLNSGCVKNELDMNGFSPEYVALLNGHYDCALLIQTQGGFINRPRRTIQIRNFSPFSRRFGENSSTQLQHVNDLFEGSTFDSDDYLPNIRERGSLYSSILSDNTNDQSKPDVISNPPNIRESGSLYSSILSDNTNDQSKPDLETLDNFKQSEPLKKRSKKNKYRIRKRMRIQANFSMEEANKGQNEDDCDDFGLFHLLDNPNCTVCMAVMRNAILLPCAHICMCMECSKQCLECPICKEKIVEYKRYFVS